MRSSKLHEPQPYLEPNSPRSKMAARGLIPPGEASSLSVATQAMGLETSDQEGQKHTPDEEENGRNTESNPGEAGAGEQSGAASSSSTTTCEAGESVRVIVTEADDEELARGTGGAESEQDQEQRAGTEMGTRVGEEEEVKVKPAPGSLYADLGDFEPVNLLSFAYQIASGMVSKMSITVCIDKIILYIQVYNNVKICTKARHCQELQEMHI